ncbi:MAG: hypothetical protein WC222_04370 [Parachlamydiales bacterium]|jgi:GcvH upstream region-like protein
MLEFFRKYQRSFFLIITFFVVISFSFFGTFNAISTMRPLNTPTFDAVDGTQITRADVDDMALFLSTDMEDKVLFGGMWGPNFLNDGVISKDFLDTGLAAIIAEKFAGVLSPELEAKLEKEKRFKGYKHPSAPFLSSLAVWNYFAPEINTQLFELQQQSSAVTPEALRSRINLYLAQKKFSEPMLKQMLLYQQQQYNWIKPDDSIVQSDLTLFGYHNLSDWFGPRFIHLLAEFIYNSSAQARELGYEVSREEALADLIKNTSTSFQQLQNNPRLGVSTTGDYFRQQLQRMNLDQGRAVHLWQQVMLFRRLYNNTGSLALVNRFAFERFGEFAGEGVVGVGYALPKALQIKDFHDLQALEMYLKSISKKGSDPLELPKTFFSVDEIINRNPELAQKRYILEIASVDKKTLQGKVSIKEMWDWETSPAGWNKIVKEFPELGKAQVTKPEDKRNAIDALEPALRAKVDFYARKEIVDMHNDWLTDALAKAPVKKQEVAISYRGNAAPFTNLKDNAQLIELLDNAPVGKGSFSDKADSMSAHASLKRFTTDETHYYSINVVEKPKTAEIIPFAAAKERGLLDPLIDASLKGYYLTIRDKNPQKFKRPDGSWKQFEEVRNEIADDYFAIILKNIRDDAVASGLMPKDAPPLTSDRAASLRLYKYMRTLRNKAATDATSLNAMVNEAITEGEGSEITWKPLPNIQDQWKLVAEPFKENRSSTHANIDLNQAFSLTLNDWSKVSTPVNGDLAFFQVTNKGLGDASDPLFDKTIEAHRLLGHEAMQKLASASVDHMLEKKAISIEFLGSPGNGASEMGLPETLPE